MHGPELFDNNSRHSYTDSRFESRSFFADQPRTPETGGEGRMHQEFLRERVQRAEKIAAKGGIDAADDPLGGMGVFGRWNVGNWCESPQALRHDIGL